MRSIKSTASALALFVTSSAMAHSDYNMPSGVSPISHDIYDLHMLIFAICCVIGVFVFGVMFYALIKHRKSKGAKAANFHDNTVLEIVWTIIPLLILVGMAVPATKVLMRMNDDHAADINIKITGHQWKWQYEYLDEGINFYSNLSTPNEQIENKAPKGEWYLLEVDKPLILPIHKKVRFLLTSADVNHSWWVPELGVKRDSIPGYITEAWTRIDKPGTYRGQCTELCGMRHGYMPIVVIAKTEKDYAKWVAEQTKSAESKKKLADEQANKVWTKPELMTSGKSTYEKYCSVCHRPDGKGMPPAFPALIGSSIATGPVEKHIDIVLHGVAGTGMQAFDQQLSDAEIAAVVTYERNAWGNADKEKYGQLAGGTLQPADVAKRR